MRPLGFRVICPLLSLRPTHDTPTDQQQGHPPQVKRHLGESPDWGHPLEAVEADSAWPSFYVGATPWAACHLGAGPSLELQRRAPNAASWGLTGQLALGRPLGGLRHILRFDFYLKAPWPQVRPAAALVRLLRRGNSLSHKYAYLWRLFFVRRASYALGPCSPREPFLAKFRPPAGVPKLCIFVLRRVLKQAI